MKRKFTIKVKAPKRRNFDLIAAQIKGLMRTKVIKNKKKSIAKKVDYTKELSYYPTIL